MRCTTLSLKYIDFLNVILLEDEGFNPIILDVEKLKVSWPIFLSHQLENMRNGRTFSYLCQMKSSNSLNLCINDLFLTFLCVFLLLQIILYVELYVSTSGFAYKSLFFFLFSLFCVLLFQKLSKVCIFAILLLQLAFIH